MTKNIKVEFKHSKYGIKRMYPVCNTAKLLCALSSNKTITDEMYFNIRKLGYTVSVDATQPIPKEITWVKLA